MSVTTCSGYYDTYSCDRYEYYAHIPSSNQTACHCDTIHLSPLHSSFPCYEGYIETLAPHHNISFHTACLD